MYCSGIVIKTFAAGPLEKPVQEDPKFEANLGFLVGYCLKTEIHTG